MADGGVVTVKGSSVTVDIQFSPVTYEVNFTESGLPSNTLWTVIVNGTYYKQTADLISLHLMNGTYTYRVVNLTGYDLTNASGTFVISGGKTGFHVQFNRLKSVTNNNFYMIGGGVVSVVAVGAIAFALRKRSIGK